MSAAAVDWYQGDGAGLDPVAVELARARRGCGARAWYERLIFLADLSANANPQRAGQLAAAAELMLHARRGEQEHD